ncbi:MAG: HAD-IA family hydrolase [Gammaproteobacteria bacterium]|nr:HAD-IA family hydrolase [Gammaproteobacteria bacterium]
MTRTTNSAIKAILFDLDGTLADTAQDLAFALNQVLIEQGKPALAFEKIRPVVSHGGIALIKLGFKLAPEDKEFEPLRQRLLTIYQDNICLKTVLFPQIQNILDYLESKQIKWGIVTNKPGWLTFPLLEAMDISPPPDTVVCGDTLEQRKPDPAPLFHACQQMNLAPEQCIYVGDARRDIEAGKAAGMQTIAIGYGYIESDDPFNSWEADYNLATELDLLNFCQTQLLS